MSSCLPEDRNLAGPDIGRADEDLDIGAGAHAIEVDERVDRVPQRIDVERVGLVWTEASGDHVHPGLVVPEAQHQVEESALGRGTGRADARRAPEGFEPAARPVDPAFQPALHQHDGIHGAGARTGDRFYAEAPVFEEGIEHAPREGAVSPAALQGERHGLLGVRPGEAGGFAPTSSKATRHRAVPVEISVMNHALVM